MKLLKLPSLLLIFILFASSCKKDEALIAEDDYLIFGHFYGFCGGEQCIEIFKLNASQLFEDQSDNYPLANQGFYNGVFNALPDSKFQVSKSLIADFPIDLLNLTDTIIGCPDCLDQGGIYLEYNFSGVHRFWIIDNIDLNQDAYLINYKQKVRDKITEINS